jgi:hypothetical protein
MVRVRLALAFAESQLLAHLAQSQLSVSEGVTATGVAAEAIIQCVKSKNIVRKKQEYSA